MDFFEKTINTDVKFKGRILTMRVDTVELPDGTTSTREIIEHPGGVAVIAVDENGYVPMVTQFRKPYEKMVMELPAGKLDSGEEPINCGMRELEEETGLKANNFVSLGSVMPSPGYAKELIYIYLATDLYEGTVHLDEGEFLSVEKYHIDELVKMVMNNELQDAKTVIGILKAAEYLKKNPL
ncbi:MAG: NUDIX hydrolase [Clostridia bacterium]|nr:NUDIX hydrolase [Clostridia bacterium]